MSFSGTTKGVYQTPEWVPVKETTIDKKIEFAWIKWTIAIEVNIRRLALKVCSVMSIRFYIDIRCLIETLDQF